MTSWSPAQRQDHPLIQAICTLARQCLMPGVVAAVATRSPEGWYRLTLPDGQRASVSLDIKPRAQVKHGPRAAIAYELAGRATLENQGFMLEGEILVDCATKAFLHVGCELRGLGQIA
jgi:hypothetical protein